MAVSEPINMGRPSPICDPSNIIYDEVRGEYICIETGEVISERLINEGPEWRAFTPEDRLRKSRTGSPTSFTVHDGGLTTDIASRSNNKLRRLHNHLRVRGNNTLVNALKLMNDVCSKLRLPKVVKEQAGLLLRKFQAANILKNRKIPELVAVAVITSAKVYGIAIDSKMVFRIVGITRDAYWKALMYISKKAGDIIKMRVADPSIYVPKISRQLGLPSQVTSLAIILLRKLKDLGALDGKGPSGMAAASVYVAGIVLDHKRTQKEIAEAVGKTEVTVRNRYKDIVEKLNIVVLM